MKNKLVKSENMNKNPKISVIGVGYVGLPLTVSLSRYFDVQGFDIGLERVRELQNGIDTTNDLSEHEANLLNNIKFTSKESDLENTDLFICCVPTPVDSINDPDFKPLKVASHCIGKYLTKGAMVVYESTVYPGATEEICQPILEKQSGYLLNEDFYLGYSPERINPGDMERRIENITKVISASNDFSLEWIDYIYSKIINAGTYRASSIKVAEAAKIIENIQRDLNIGLVNELSCIFEKVGIDTNEVLDASATKWNFIKFKPGLVGGHCIGVDPYYLSYKSIMLGHTPELILSARKINEDVSQRIATKATQMLNEKNILIKETRTLVLGATFKENCTDIRNSKVFDLIMNLTKNGLAVDVYDPIANFGVNFTESINLVTSLEKGLYDLIILAVPHKEIVCDGIEALKAASKNDSLFFDLKSYFNIEHSDFRL